jgi:hypothetical protein
LVRLQYRPRRHWRELRTSCWDLRGNHRFEIKKRTASAIEPSKSYWLSASEALLVNWSIWAPYDMPICIYPSPPSSSQI